METIKNYLDNVFATFPQSGQIQILKRDMLANMEEKYTMLRQSGKSEHEATYSVIANFGNIEEIIAELGLDVRKEEMDTNVFVPSEEAQAYLSKSKKNGVLIGFGVWLIMAGASSVLILDNVFVMFLAIAIAVAIFIVSSNGLRAYEAFHETPIRLDTYTREMVENERIRSMTWHTALTVVGVVLIILAVGAFTVMNFPVSLFLNIVGFSVFLFIVADSYSSPYNVLLGKKEIINKEAYKQASRIIGTIAAVYWPTVTAIFLLWSFTRDAWGTSWVIWPIAGILFGAISGGVSIWFGTKEKSKQD